MYVALLIRSHQCVHTCCQHLFMITFYFIAHLITALDYNHDKFVFVILLCITNEDYYCY